MSEDNKIEVVERAINDNMSYENTRIKGEVIVINNERYLKNFANKEYKRTEIKTHTNEINNFRQLDEVGASAHILSQLYKKNNFANKAMNDVANIVTATAPLYRLKSNKKTNQNLKKLELYKSIIDNPNRGETSYTFFHKIALSLVKFGNAYIQIIKNKRGELHSLYFIPFNQIRVKSFINKTTGLPEVFYVETDYATGVPARVLYEDEIIHIKLPNDENTLYGLAPSVPLFLQYIFDGEAKKWINGWLTNTFASGTIFKQENATKEVIRRNSQMMNEVFSGGENAGATLILEGDMALIYDGNKIKDIDFGQLKMISRDDIITCYGLSISTVGMRTSIGTANAEQIEAEAKATLRNVAIKYQSVIAQAITQQLFKMALQDFDTELTFGNNTTFTSKESVELVKIASQYAGTTINENRSILNIPTNDSVEYDEYYNEPLIATNNGILQLKVLFDNFRNQSKQAIDTNAINNPNKIPTIKNNPDNSTLTVE